MWLLRMKPDMSGNVQLFDNATASGTPIQELSIRRLESITINGNAGDDRLIVDLTYGVPFRDTQLIFNGGAHISGDSFEIKGNNSTKGSYNPGGIANADTLNAARKTIYLNDVEPVTVSGFAVLKLITPNPNDAVNIDSPTSGHGRITGSSSGVDLGELNFSETSALVVDAAVNDGAAGQDTIAVASAGAAAMGLSALYVHAGTGVNSLSIAGGSTTLRSTVAPSGTGFLNVTVSNSAVLNLPTTQYLGTLTINDTARVNLTSNVYKCLLLENLSISSTGTLDLADNDLIVHNGDTQAITNWIASGRAGGAWNGYGITSSTAGTTAGGGYTALGVMANQNQYNQTLYSTWSNQTVTGSDVLVKFSYSGDANLDGTVNSDDYYRIDSGYLNHLTGWYNGDFDYSGAVASGDYYLIDSNYLYQGNIGRKPPFTIGWGSSVQEGDAYEISLFAPLSEGGTNYDPIGSWTIFWGDEEISTVQGNPGQTVYAQHVYADDSGAGTYQISVAANGTDLSYWAGNHALAVTNVPPSLGATGASQIDEGDEYSLELSWSDPGDDVGHWQVDWGDGTPIESVDWDIDGAYHTFVGVSSAQIYAMAEDEDGWYVADPVDVTITRKFTLDGAGAADEGSSYSLSLMTSAATHGNVRNWTVNWGDGSPAEIVTDGRTTLTHTYPDDNYSGYAITSTAEDDDGIFDADPLWIVILNVAPTVSVGGNASVDEGSSYRLTLSATGDPGPDTISGWTIDWGDGAVEEVAGNPDHVDHPYNGLEATRTIYAWASDEDGWYDAPAITVTVNNLAPTATVGGLATVAVGSAYTLNLDGTDAGGDPIASWVIDWGEGAAAENVPWNPSQFYHTFEHEGTYTISAIAYDKDGAQSSSTTKAIQVLPTLDIWGLSTVGAGSEYTLNLAFSEPGSLARDPWTIDWGDGSDDTVVDRGMPSVTHTYASMGAYTVTANGNGGQWTAEPMGVTAGAAQDESLIYTILLAADSGNRAGASDLHRSTTYVISSGPTTSTIQEVVAGYADDWNVPGGTTHQFKDSSFETTIGEDPDGVYRGRILFNWTDYQNGFYGSSGQDGWDILFVPLTVSVAPFITQLDEGASQTITFSHNGGTDAPDITINMEKVRGTASTSDYNFPTSVTIPAGQSQVTQAFEALDDSEIDWKEDLALEVKRNQFLLDPNASPLKFFIANMDAPILTVPAGPLVANFDDTDGDGLPDDQDPTVMGDNLYAIQLGVPVETQPGAHVTLSVESFGTSAIRLWPSRDRTSEEDALLLGSRNSISWPAGSIPAELYLEITNGSSFENDLRVSLTLSDGLGVSVDRTAVGVKIDWNPPAGRTLRQVLPGELIDLSLDVQAPVGWLSGMHWQKPSGKPFLDYSPTWGQGTLTDMPADPNDSLYFGSDLTFYWADSGQQSVAAEVTLAGHTYSTAAAFTVSPVKSKMQVDVLGKADFDRVGNFLGFYGDGKPGPGFFKGPGFVLRAAVDTPARFEDGQWMFVQLVDMQLTELQQNQIEGTSRIMLMPAQPLAQPALDEYVGYPMCVDAPNVQPPYVPFGNLAPADNTWRILQDTPGYVLESPWIENLPPDIPPRRWWIFEAQASMQFSTYILFKPAGALGQWVPLKKIDWWWSGKVYWDRVRYRLSLPARQQGAGNVTETSDHPTWTVNIETIKAQDWVQGEFYG